MLQTVAQKITGEEELVINFNNKQLPINHAYYPLSHPSVAEVYGVAVLAAVFVGIRELNTWHGKPINSGFHDAFLAKGGYKMTYAFTKYLKGVLANAMIVAIVSIMIYARGFRMPGTTGVLLSFCLVNPLMVIGMSTSVALRAGLSYKVT